MTASVLAVVRIAVRIAVVAFGIVALTLLGLGRTTLGLVALLALFGLALAATLFGLGLVTLLGLGRTATRTLGIVLAVLIGIGRTALAALGFVLVLGLGVLRLLFGKVTQEQGNVHRHPNRLHVSRLGQVDCLVEHRTQRPIHESDRLGTNPLVKSERNLLARRVVAKPDVPKGATDHGQKQVFRHLLLEALLLHLQDEILQGFHLGKRAGESRATKPLDANILDDIRPSQHDPMLALPKLYVGLAPPLVQRSLDVLALQRRAPRVARVPRLVVRATDKGNGRARRQIIRRRRNDDMRHKRDLRVRLAENPLQLPCLAVVAVHGREERAARPTVAVRKPRPEGLDRTPHVQIVQHPVNRSLMRPAPLRA